MKIRLFDIDTDFDTIKDWVVDGRTHVMWSANRMVYPLDIRAKKFYEKIGFKERRIVENAFAYKDESWNRCNMVISSKIFNLKHVSVK